MNSLEKERKSEKKKPRFQRLGIFVTDNYKIILIVWLFILGSAVYPAIRLQKVLSYNELEFLPDNLEYHEGEVIFNELFPSNSTGNTIIVIQSNSSITSQEILDYIEALTERIYQDYSDSILDLQSILTVFNSYNDSYWDLMNSAKLILNETLYNEINIANQAMYTAKTEIEDLWNQISVLYLLSWFNISRTYYYGVYNTSLFDSGPSSSVYQTVALETNFTDDMSITEEYIDLVYNSIHSNLPDPYLLNDQELHGIVLEIVNATLFQEINDVESMSIETYNEEIYPYLFAYYNNWTDAFYQQITDMGYSIINGTHLSSNMYSNTTIPNAYLSQNIVLATLQSINNTSYSGFDVKSIILLENLESLDMTMLIEEFVTYLPISIEELESNIEPLLPIFVEQIYNLGPNPSTLALTTLTTEMINQITDIITLLYPPIESIDDLPEIVSQWVLSEDGKTSLLLVMYNGFGKTLDEIDQMVKAGDAGIGQLAHDLADEMNLVGTNIYHTGDEMVTNTWVTLTGEDAMIIDIFTIVFVLIILLVVFCSIVAPLIPLIAIGSSIAVSMAILWFISFGMDIHFLAVLFLTITSLGAGVDYCIFIFSRYNEERKKDYTKQEAMITAMTYAGESVFHSGLTVMVGFGAMIIPNFPLLRVLGIAMVVGITISMSSALIVVPAMIMLLGDVVWWPRILQVVFRPQKWFKGKEKATLENELENVPEGTSIIKKKENEQQEHKKNIMIRFSNFITKNGLIITTLTLVSVVPFIYFTATMETSTDFMGMLPKDFEGTIGRDILSEAMAVGDPTSINILFYDLNQSPLEYDLRIQTAIITESLMTIDHVSTIRATVRPLGLLMIDAIDGPFESYTRSFVGKDNRSMLIEIYIDKSPYAKETEDFLSILPTILTDLIDSRNLDLIAEGKIHYLGYGQALYEIKQVTDGSYPIVIPIVIVGVYLVLFFLFGSYFTPIRLILTITMGIGITLGLLQLVFAIGFNVPIFWLLPIMLFSILMGLGLDYDIFLVTRIKEYYDKGLSNKDAIAQALNHTASIITSCGTVMAAAYSTLIISRLWHLRELGFAFAIAIILDATLIRLIVVPAMMVLLEKLNWKGPKWLMKRRHYSPEIANSSENSNEIITLDDKMVKR